MVIFDDKTSKSKKWLSPNIALKKDFMQYLNNHYMNLKSIEKSGRLKGYLQKLINFKMLLKPNKQGLEHYKKYSEFLKQELLNFYRQNWF